MKDKQLKSLQLVIISKAFYSINKFFTTYLKLNIVVLIFYEYIIPKK